MRNFNELNLLMLHWKLMETAEVIMLFGNDSDVKYFIDKDG